MGPTEAAEAVTTGMWTVKSDDALDDQTAEHVTDSDSPVSDIVRAAILDTGYETALRSEKTDEADGRIENLQELVNAAVDYDEQGLEGLREFIDHSALVSDQDEYKRDAPVTLMTAHSAKGLEFPVVFIVGLEDGLQDQRVGAVTALFAARHRRRGEEPAPVFRLAEQRGEAGAGIEAREATPIDRPVTADQRGRLQVPDQRIVLDPRHG